MSSTIKSFTVSAQNVFSDGSPVASKNIQYQLILDGANLFQAGVDGCLPTPAHVAGTVIEEHASDSQGNISENVGIQSFRAAVVRQCSLRNLNPSQIEGLTIRASVLADADTCPVYCSAQAQPASDCVSDCETGNRTLLGSQVLSASDVSALVASSRDGNIQWSGRIVYSGIGPALTPGEGPDLQVDGAAAQSSAHISRESFTADSCEVAEGCVRAAGARTVLRFDGTIQNLGTADLVIGSPENSGLFNFSSCHNVNLLKNIMLYELVDPATGQVVQTDGQAVIGRKQGFCMMDITQVNATAPQGQFDCDNQGITRGWADVYDSALDCQFLDITGVPPGNYSLRLTANPDGLFDEVDTTNNTVSIPVTIPAQ